MTYKQKLFLEVERHGKRFYDRDDILLAVTAESLYSRRQSRRHGAEVGKFFIVFQCHIEFAFCLLYSIIIPCSTVFGIAEVYHCFTTHTHNWSHPCSLVSYLTLPF